MAASDDAVRVRHCHCPSQTLLRAALASALVLLAATALSLSQNAMTEQAGSADLIRSYGSLLFAAERASVAGGELALLNARQIAETAGPLGDATPRNLYAKWLVFTNDPLEGEVLKVHHAALVAVGDSVLATEPVAKAMASMNQPIPIKRDVLRLVKLKANGSCEEVRIEHVEFVTFQFSADNVSEDR